MENRDRLELDGVVKSMNKSIFLVDVSTNGTPNIVKCSLSGKIRQNSLKILVDDRVKIEVSPYDLSQGRIVYRYK